MITNLRIAHIEIRTEEDPALAPYVNDRLIETIRCEPGCKGHDQMIKKALMNLCRGALNTLQEHSIVHFNNPANLNFVVVEEAARYRATFFNLMHPPPHPTPP